MTAFVDLADSKAAVPRSQTDVEQGLFGAVRRLVHVHERQTDLLFAAAILCLSMLWLTRSPFSEWQTVLVQCALVVPLIWRRSHPVAVFVIVCLVGFTQWLVGYRLIADVALLIALYTVAVHGPRVRALLAAGILEVGAAMAATRFLPAGTAPRSFLFLTATVCTALFAGLTVRSGSEYMVWLAERAERLEVERDQQAAIGAALERTRIAREMHDIVAHSLSVVITMADAATVVVGSQPERAAEAMRRASDVGRQALSDMRTMIGVLRTEDSGLALGPQPNIAQLDALFERVRGTGLDVQTEIAGPPFPLGGATELSIYRIVQEALTNTIKHAHATQVRVVLRYDHPRVELTVADNGSGGAAGRNGHGIEGMCERAGLHGGELKAGPVGRGWEVSATLHSDATVVPA